MKRAYGIAGVMVLGLAAAAPASRPGGRGSPRQRPALGRISGKDGAMGGDGGNGESGILVAAAHDDLSRYRFGERAFQFGREVELACRIALHPQEEGCPRVGEDNLPFFQEITRVLRERELGNAPAVIYLAGCYGVFALEELLSLLGTPVRESLLPAVKQTSSPDAPT